MNTKHTTTGHLLALFTVIVWGTTFVSTKVLLQDFTPAEILFIRFTIGFIMLIIMYPQRLRVTDKKHEIYFVLAGFTGITLYYLIENIALTYTTASNVGILVSVAPFFIAIVTRFFFKTEKVGVRFFVGFGFAITGIAIISFNGAQNISINPLGDLLAVLAAVTWAFYSVIVKKISSFGYNTIQTTRRSFFYGIIFMIPFLFIMDVNFDIGGFARFTNIVNVGNLLFLSIGASAICFVTWNMAVKYIGPIKTSAYIYLAPVVTVITSVIVLHEKITILLLAGIGFILAGLWLSESRSKKVS